MRRGLSVGLALGLMAGLAAVASGAVTRVGAAASCASTPIAIHHVVRPGDGVSLYTANEQEVTAAAAYGFTERLGVAFYAARRLATRTWCRSTALRSHRLATSVDAKRRGARGGCCLVRLHRPGPVLRSPHRRRRLLLRTDLAGSPNGTMHRFAV